MRLLLNILLASTIALTLGFWLSWFALTGGRELSAVTIGPWATWPDIGTANPNPYVRAYLARSGVLPLGRSEGVQFSASHDSSGEPIDPGCTYLVAGKTPQETFWTLTASATDGEVVVAKNTPLFVDSMHIARGPEGAMAVHIGPALVSGNWLQTDGETPYHLLLTLYDSAVFSGLGTSVSEMPTVTKEACR